MVIEGMPQPHSAPHITARGMWMVVGASALVVLWLWLALAEAEWGSIL